MDARWRVSATMSNVFGASGCDADLTRSYRGHGSPPSCSVVLYLLCAWFTVSTVTQRELDSKSRMRESCTSGSVGAPAE
jgi:hypothetical protein